MRYLKLIALFIAILVFAGTGIASAQNPDLSQNPQPDQATIPQDQANPPVTDPDQEQDIRSNHGQLMSDGTYQDQSGNTYQNDQQDERPPMSEQPPPLKPSPSMSGPGPSAPADEGNYNETSNSNGVARVSLIHGNVSTQRGDSGDWSAAQLNAPLVAGDRVSTGDQSRVELQLDYANILRLAEHTQANVTNLTRSRIQVQLGHGMANYTVLGNSEAEADIETPNVSIRTEGRDASFRLLVTADDHTEVLVRRGEVELTTAQGGTRVHENQFIVVRGVGDQTQYRIGEAPARDDWDQWNTDRDRLIRSSVSRRHTNDYYVGSEDMDAYGSWRDVPDYGSAWFPNEGPDWVPYRAGNWVYEPYWGWTWVSYEPWGWAPYHYGRWFLYNGAWGWWPGPVYGYPAYYPVWAPAYVSFFGWGGGWGFGFGFGGGWGSIGWFPIGPCDYFHPWWGPWGGRFGVTNITNVNIYNRGGFGPLHGGHAFSNVRLAVQDPHFRGATGVNSQQFGHGHAVFQPVGHSALSNARFATGNLPVVPSRESLSASGRPAAPGTAVNRGGNQRFFSPHGTAPRVNRSFENERTQLSNAMQRSGVRPVMGGSQSGFEGRSNARIAQPGFRNEPSRTAGPAGTNRGPAQSGNTGSNEGFRTFNRSGENASPRSNMENRGNWGSAPRPGGTVNTPPARESGPSNGGGWQRFTPMPPRASEPSPRGSSSYGSGSYGPGTGGRGSYGPGTEYRGSYGPGTENRGAYRAPQPSPRERGYSSGESYRPPLNMRQPIVTPRSYGRDPGYGGGRAPSYGGGRSAPSFGGGGRSAPSGGGGGHSAPSGGSHGGGGGSHGGGGGGSHGGRH